MMTDPTTAPSGVPDVPPPTDPAPPPAPEPVPLRADTPAPGEPRVADVPPIAEPGNVTAESPALRATLRRIFEDPQYRPAAGPAGGDPGELTDAEVDKLWQDYQDVPDGEEKQAYKRMLLQATDLALKRVQGLSTKQRIDETNKQRAVQQATALKSAINAQVQQLAPEVDLDLFWEWGAQIAQREAQAHRFPDVPAALDWQVRRAIQLVRGKLGTPAAGTPTARGTRGSRPPRPRTMVDQLNAMQRAQRGDY
jgi:hypothetical protein